MQATKAARKKRGILHRFLILIVALVALVAIVGVGTRYLVLTPQVLLLIEARTTGLKLGRFGTLGVEGITGDIFTDFRVRRLTVRDEAGVWLEARNVHVQWDYWQLFNRRFAAELVEAEKVDVFRRPTLTPKTRDRDLPVSFDIDRLAARVETHPDLSIERGLFDLSGDLEVSRGGGGAGNLQALSLLHEGDRAVAKFSFGRGRDLLIDAEAVEAKGGAIAGALGLPADRPFRLDVMIGGSLGDIDVVATSGDETPLEVTGGWTDSRLSARGRLDITASSLTRDWVDRLGPTFAFTADAVRRGETGSTFDLTLEADAENLDFTARGPVDVAQRSASDVAIEASMEDVSRIVETPRIGPARFTGRLTGSLPQFSLNGRLEAAGLGLMGFEARRIGGDVEVARRRGDWLVEADLATAGGSGEELFARLLGSAPKGSVALTRFADGRLLIRALQVEGDRLEVTGRGSRTPVIGTLNFEGDLRTTNIEAIRPGASGTVTARWSASRGGDNRPWAFTAVAQGAEFSTGLAQLDRMVGTRPRLDARMEMAEGGAWRITRSRLDGEAGDATAEGVYGPDNALALNVNWDARGPFRAGPVEIAGNISGEGRVTGTLTEPRADLTARIPGIDVGDLALENAVLNLSFAQSEDGSSGSIRLAADSNHGRATARSAFRFTDAGVDLSGIDANAGGVTALGSLSLRNNQPSRADLTVTARAGAFLDAGQAEGRVVIVDAPGGPQADVSLRGSDLRFAGNPIVVRTVQLTARGPLERLPYTLRGEARRGETPFVLNGSGVVAEAADGYALSFTGEGRIDTIRMATIEPLNVAFGGETLGASGLVSVGGGRAQFTARQQDDQVTIEATMTGVDLELLSPDLDGRFDATLTASGRGANLSGELNARLENMRSRGGPTDSAIDGTLQGRLQGNRIELAANISNEVGLRSTASALLPAEASAAPFRIAISRTRPIQGEFNIDGELRPIWDLFFGGARTIGGRVRAQGTVGGTINEPQVTGTASLANGELEDFASGLKLREVTLQATLQRDSITVNQFSGRDEGRGSVEGEGRIDLRGGASSFVLVARNFLLIDNDLVQAQASGRTTITRAADGRMTLVGALNIERADIVAEPPTPSNVVRLDVLEINVPPERADYFDAPRGRGPSIALNVDLDADRRVFVEGRGLNVELSLDAHVGGTTSSPVLTGIARVVRGEYEFAGKRFEFDTSGVVYLGSTAEAIRLDLTATRYDPALTAVINIDGTAAKPEISLSSTPALPNDEILSQVLFGRSASQLSAVEAAQLAASTLELATGGGFNVMSGLRNFAGLDRLIVGGDEGSGLSVSGGKYVSDDVYIELTGGGREGGAAQVEWRVRRNLSFISRVAGDGDTRLSIRWRRETGRPQD